MSNRRQPLFSAPPLALGDASVIARSASIITAEVQGEVVMMSVEKGRYFGLDDIGSDIWRRLETPRTFGALIDALAADYRAERDVIAEDVRKLLAEMAARGVVTVG